MVDLKEADSTFTHGKWTSYAFINNFVGFKETELTQFVRQALEESEPIYFLCVRGDEDLTNDYLLVTFLQYHQTPLERIDDRFCKFCKANEERYAHSHYYVPRNNDRSPDPIHLQHICPNCIENSYLCIRKHIENTSDTMLAQLI